MFRVSYISFRLIIFQILRDIRQGLLQMSREGRIGKKTNFRGCFPDSPFYISFHSRSLIHSILNETLTCIYHLKNTFHFDCAMTMVWRVWGKKGFGFVSCVVLFNSRFLFHSYKHFIFNPKQMTHTCTMTL